MSKERKELTENEAWVIVEGLMESHLGLKEKGYSEAAEKHEEILDKLSPNWRSADSCKDVKIRDIFVEES